MSLDLRFKDARIDKEEQIIELPLSTNQEEAELFASKINHLINGLDRA